LVIPESPKDQKNLTILHYNYSQFLGFFSSDPERLKFLRLDNILKEARPQHIAEINRIKLLFICTEVKRALPLQPYQCKTISYISRVILHTVI